MNKCGGKKDCKSFKKIIIKKEKKKKEWRPTSCPCIHPNTIPREGDKTRIALGDKLLGASLSNMSPIDFCTTNFMR